MPGTVDSTNNNFLETNNIGLQGTYCVSGAALGLVVGTGDQTVFGRIAGSSNGRRTEMTLMQKEILRFVLIIVGFVVAFVLIIVIVWYAKVYSIGNMRILNVARLGLLTCTKTTPISSTFQRLSSAVSVLELPLFPRVFLLPFPWALQSLLVL